MPRAAYALPLENPGKHRQSYSHFLHEYGEFDVATVYILRNTSSQWRHDEITSVSIVFAQSFVQAQIKENIKALRHWPLWGEFTGDRWIPRTKGQWRGNISIWWRHHAASLVWPQCLYYATLKGNRSMTKTSKYPSNRGRFTKKNMPSY